jgi:hypothetical protein
MQKLRREFCQLERHAAAVAAAMPITLGAKLSPANASE